MDKHIIIAPHADDEIIGCFEVLLSQKNVFVAFPNMETMEEARISENTFAFTPLLFKNIDFLNKTDSNIIYHFPDPAFELHPLHKHFGSLGRSFGDAGLKIVYYSTNMNSPYIREVKSPNEKRNALNICYKEKTSLWEYEHKYFLFESHINSVDYARTK